MAAWDVVVIGAGIVGCAVARECAAAGLHTALIEGGVPAGGASAAGMGHVVIMDDSPAQLALSSYSRSLWQAEEKLLPAAAEYEARGTLWVAADAEEMGEVASKRHVYAGAGIESQVLSAAQLAAAEPNLRPGLAGALLVPGDGVIYPPAAAAFYLEEALKLGAKLHRSRAVRAAGGEVALEDGTALQAERIVLAVGSQCDLLPTLPIEKRKGHLLITDRYPGFAHHQLVELGYLKSAHKVASDSVAFNIQPRQTGQMLIGSSRQYGNHDPAADPKILREMLDRACEYMPALRHLSTIRVWTGFRAASKDKLPFIGPASGLSDDPSLWLVAGFEGLGITNAPGAACLLVDRMLGRPGAIPIEPYLAARVAPIQTAAEAPAEAAGKPSAKPGLAYA